MKVGNIAIILKNMTRFEFWCFMRSPFKERWRILRMKAKKEKK